MPRPDPEDRQHLDAFIRSYEEFKAPYFRAYQPKPTDSKRVWALVLSSNWRGSGIERMERLLRAWPKAVEQAARSPAFPATTGIWQLAQSAAAIERLAQGIVPGRPEEIEVYDQQVLRVRLPEATTILVRGEAARRGITASAYVAEVIEDWVERG